MADEMPGMVETKTVANMANQVDAVNLSKFYANHANVNISLFEIRLVLNFVTGVNPENGHLYALEQMLVAMSPELTKAVHGMLGKALESYTHDYGSIRGPIAANIKHVKAEESVKSAMDMASEFSPEAKRD